MAQRAAMLQLVERLRDAGSAHRGGLGQVQAAVRQARPVAAARTPGAAARPGLAVAGAVVDGRLAGGPAKTRTRACPAAVSSPASASSAARAAWSLVNDAGINAGAIQRMGGDKLLRAQAIAMEKQAALRAADRIGRRQPAAVQGGRLHQRRAAVLQPGAAVGRRHPGDRPGARLVHRRRRLHAGAVGLRDHGARPRQGLPGRAAAAEGRHRRDRQRRGTGRRRDAHQRVRPGRVPGRGRCRRAAHRARAAGSGCSGAPTARPA